MAEVETSSLANLPVKKSVEIYPKIIRQGTRLNGEEIIKTGDCEHCGCLFLFKLCQMKSEDGTNTIICPQKGCEKIVRLADNYELNLFL